MSNTVTIDTQNFDPTGAWRTNREGALEYFDRSGTCHNAFIRHEWSMESPEDETFYLRISRDYGTVVTEESDKLGVLLKAIHDYKIEADAEVDSEIE